ncbi:MAG: RodZ domain-containing protein [Actinomycetota bacterium]
MSLGSIVKQARKSAGVSIEDLAYQTKIRAALLRDIEEDNFTKCGGDAYARGHLRNIALILGAQPSVFIDRFDSEQAIAVRPMGELLRENSVTAPPHIRSRISLKALSIVSATAVFMVVGGQVVYTNAQAPKTNTAKSFIASAKSAPTTLPTSDSNAVQDESTTDPNADSVGDFSTVTHAVNVEVTAKRGASWISVYSETGKSLFTGYLNLGQSGVYSDDSPIKIRFGNAGAVDVVVNGEATAAPGANGAVVDMVYGASSGR